MKIKRVLLIGRHAAQALADVTWPISETAPETITVVNIKLCRFMWQGNHVPGEAYYDRDTDTVYATPEFPEWAAARLRDQNETISS